MTLFLLWCIQQYFILVEYILKQEKALELKWGKILFERYNKKTKFAGSVLYKLTGNNKIAKKKIGWTPKYNLNSGINLTIKKLNNYKLC